MLVFMGGMRGHCAYLSDNGVRNVDKKTYLRLKSHIDT